MRKVLMPWKFIKRTTIASQLGQSRRLFASSPSRLEKTGFMTQFRYFLRPPQAPNGFEEPQKVEKLIAKLIGATCFFWVFYRFRKDGLVYLGIKDQFEGLYDLDYDKDYIPLARD